MSTASQSNENEIEDGEDEENDGNDEDNDRASGERQKKGDWMWMGEIPVDGERLDGQDHLGEGSRTGGRHRH